MMSQLRVGLIFGSLLAGAFWVGFYCGVRWIIRRATKLLRKERMKALSNKKSKAFK